MTITVTITKEPLSKFQPSKYCKWCVEVETDDADGFTSDEGLKVPLQWAVDFSSDIDILDPEQAKHIPGAPKYSVDPGPDEGTFTKPGDKTFKICFVAACSDRADTDMSLENRLRVPGAQPGQPGMPQGWNRVPFDGGPNGVGKIVGPAPK